MITRRTKVQLVIFLIITLVGVTFVGTKYARLDRFVRTDSFDVTLHLASTGGSFQNSEVAYRGVKVGTISDIELLPDGQGVDATLRIDEKWNDKIPSDLEAVVANRSAVGEQYVDLQPRTDDGPFLTKGSQIAKADTQTPLPTQKILGDAATTIGSVDRKALRTTVLELGKAFEGTGPDLQTIIDSGTSFIDAANRNFDVTTSLIQDGNTVLNTQIASDDSIHQFANQLSLFSDTLARSDGDLRTVIDQGSFATIQLRKLIQENRVPLGELLSELITTGRVVVKNLPGIQQILVLYPYIVEGGFTVVVKDSDGYRAHFGMIMGSTTACTQGYGGTKHRSPNDGSNVPMNTKASCTDPTKNFRGSLFAPDNRPAADFKASSVVANYDASSGKLAWRKGTVTRLTTPASVTTPSSGQESWKWLYEAPFNGR